MSFLIRGKRNNKIPFSLETVFKFHPPTPQGNSDEAAAGLPPGARPPAGGEQGGGGGKRASRGLRPTGSHGHEPALQHPGTRGRLTPGPAPKPGTRASDQTNTLSRRAPAPSHRTTWCPDPRRHQVPCHLPERHSPTQLRVGACRTPRTGSLCERPPPTPPPWVPRGGHLGLAGPRHPVSTEPPGHHPPAPAALNSGGRSRPARPHRPPVAPWHRGCPRAGDSPPPSTPLCGPSSPYDLALESQTPDPVSTARTREGQGAVPAECTVEGGLRCVPRAPVRPGRLPSPGEKRPTQETVTCGQESGIRAAENLFKMPMRVLLIKTNSAKLNKSNN